MRLFDFTELTKEASQNVNNPPLYYALTISSIINNISRWKAITLQYPVGKDFSRNRVSGLVKELAYSMLLLYRHYRLEPEVRNEKKNHRTLEVHLAIIHLNLYSLIDGILHPRIKDSSRVKPIHKANLDRLYNNVLNFADDLKIDLTKILKQYDQV